MKFKKISARLFAGIVPFVCVALVVVIAISTAASKKEIGIQIDEKMQSFMDSTDSALANSMKEIENITDSMAVHLGKTLKNGQDLSEINEVMTKYIEDSELIVAMGVFFNPEYWRGPIINDYVVYDSGQMLVMDLTDTDLTPTEWYIHCSTEKTPFFTETYVDTTIGILMTSYVSPILDEKGNFVGVVNTDVDMSVVQNYVAEASIGETGKVALISTEGFYLSSVPSEMILVNTIYEDEEFADIADSILTGEYQMFETNKGRVVFSRAVNNYDWILLVTMDSADMYSAITELVSTTTVVGIISVIICILAIGLISASIVKPIVKLNGMTDQMAAGDYSIEPAKVNSKDEVGKMSEALNSMLSSNRNEMLEISKNSSIVSENCNTLNEAVDDLNDSFNVIKDAISEINELMMDNSATTEELSASVTEVKKAVDDLSEESRNSNQLSLEVRQRATKIGAESKKNFDEAMELNKQYEEKLSVSIENSKVVEDIERMAIAINDIADQINLLSLNASIEAARAGESGRGFAVVAGEIGNLANQTAQTVAEIQTTIVKVKESVSALANDSHKLIDFINDKVSPDYKAFVDTASQYEKDAVSMQELSSFVSEIAQNLSETMSDVNIAINSIAEASQGSAEKSSVIINSVDTVAHHVEDVEAISAEQKNISDTLDEVVKRYKL